MSSNPIANDITLDYTLSGDSNSSSRLQWHKSGNVYTSRSVHTTANIAIGIKGDQY